MYKGSVKKPALACLVSSGGVFRKSLKAKTFDKPIEK